MTTKAKKSALKFCFKKLKIKKIYDKMFDESHQTFCRIKKGDVGVKKIVSFILAISVLCTGFYASAEDAQKYGKKIFYNRTYQGGNPFENITVASKSNNIVCKEESGGNKYILLEANENPTEDCYLQYAFKEQVSDETVFEISVKGTDNMGKFNLRLSDSTDKRIYLMNIDSSGSVRFEGGESASLKKDKWTKFAFAVNFEKHTMQIYIDSKKKGKVVNLDQTFTKPSRILTYMATDSAAKSTVSIDDFKIYEASEPTDIGVSQQDETVIVPVYKADGDCTNEIYYNRSYSEEGMDPFAGVSVSKKKQQIAICQKDENSYIGVDLIENGDCFLKWNIADGADRFITVSADFYITKLGAKIRPFQSFCEIRPDGSVVYLPWSAKVGKIKENEWFNIAFSFDRKNGACDMYLDGERVAEALAYSGDLNSFTSYFADKTADNQSIYIDNYKIYAGKQIREIKEGELPEKKSVIKQDNSDAEEIIKKAGGNVVMLNVYSSAIYYGGEKRKIDVGAYIKDNRTLVPVRAVSEAFGLDVDYNAENKCVTIDGKAKIVLGSTEMTLLDGSKYTLDVGAELENNRTMLPLRALCEKILLKEVAWDSRGLIIISDKAAELSQKELAELNSFMLYERPDAQSLKNKIINTNHPRVAATKEDFDAIRASYASNNHYIKKWGDEVIKNADNVLKTANPEYKTGGLLDLSAAVADRLENLGMAYQITNDKKYAQKAYEIIKAVGDFPDWNPAHFLDVGEMSMGVAVGYDWCYDAFTSEQQSKIEKIIYKQCLSLYEAAYYNQITYTSFIKTYTNWNSWCNGPAIMCAAAVFDKYPDLCADLISKMLRSQEIMLNEYYPDGAWMEGTGYWNIALFPIAIYSDTLKNTFGTDFNVSKTPGMDKSAYFSFAVQGPCGTNDFHDSDMVYQNCPVLFWCAKEYGDSRITKMHLAQMDKYMQSGNAYSMLWYDKKTDAEFANLDKDMYIKGGEVVSLRSSWENDNGAFVSYHAGVSDINHGQLDTGTYVIDMLGERFAMDLGKESYSVPLYFGSERYNYYRCRPEGHNLYVINPKEGKLGQEKDTFCEVSSFVSSERGAYSTVDLTACYAPDVNVAKRGYKLEDDRQSVVIADEIDLKAESEIYWFMHTDADIQIADKNTLYLTKNGKKVKLMISCSADDYSVYETAANPLPTSPEMTGELDRSSVKKICIKIKSGGKVNIWAKMAPANLEGAALETKSMSEWKNDEGEIKKMPELDMIYADGKEIEGFDKGTAGYEMRFAYDAQSVPNISAAYDQNLYDVEIKQAASFGDSVHILVKYKENSTLIGEYSVKFEKNIKLDDIEDMTRLQVINAYASSVPEKQHTPFMAADNDITAESRWAASGSGEWLCMDLGDSFDIDAVGIAVMNGSKRKYKYEIEYSADGKTWEKAVSLCETSGTDGIEIVKFERVNARYVRYVGYENSQNAWNSVTEFAVLQNRRK